MDTDRLRYFCTIAQTGSLREASQVLRLSPPALSKAVKLLESEVGAKLILPSGRGIVITDAGRTLAQRGLMILKELDSLKAQMGRSTASHSVIRLGSFEVFSTYFLGDLLAEQREGHDFILHELPPGQLEQALIDRHIDLGITYLPIPYPDIERVEVTRIQMGVFSLGGAFKAKKFAELPFVVPVEPIHGSPNKVMGLDGWPDDRVPRNIQFKVALMESALEICRRGWAVAYLPRFVVKLHNLIARDHFRLEEIHPPAQSAIHRKNSSQPVFLIRRKSDLESQAMRHIARALRKMS